MADRDAARTARHRHDPEGCAACREQIEAAYRRAQLEADELRRELRRRTTEYDVLMERNRALMEQAERTTRELLERGAECDTLNGEVRDMREALRVIAYWSSATLEPSLIPNVS